MPNTLPIDRLGVKSGDLVMEVGYGSDCDDELRAALVSLTGSPLVDENSNEVVEAVIIWFRDGDGDLGDYLMDGLTYLTENGSLWLLTPKFSRDGYVDPSEISDAVAGSGLAQSTSFSITQNWSATRIVTRKSSKGSAKNNL